MAKPFNNGDRIIGRTKDQGTPRKTRVALRAEGSSHEQIIGVKWDDGSDGAYSLETIVRDGCVSNKLMRLRNDDRVV